MAKLTIDGPDLVVGLSWLEKLGAFRGNVRVPLHAVRAGFNQRMADALDASGLAAVWAQVIGTAGEYQGMGEPLAHQAGDYTVIDVPLRFEAAEMTGRVSYDRAGQVAGLYFLNQH